MSIKDNIARVMEQVNAAEARSGNTGVTVVAVSKTHPAEAIIEAASGGITHFGENRIQEALPKIDAVHAAGITPVWHLVGHLQSNKAKKAAGVFTWLHSLDSLSTAAELDKHLGKANDAMDVLIEVNTTGETSKNGISPDETAAFAEQLGAFPALHLKGLMTMGPLYGSDTDTRRAFALLHSLRDSLQTAHPTCTELSMGMSGDFIAAIEEGATMVRIGSSIFR